MDRWRSRGGKSQSKEEEKWQDQRGERARRKKMQLRERKAAGAEPSGQWKIARPGGVKHISKSKCTKQRTFKALLKLGCSRSARCCGAKHISKSKVQKTDGAGPLCEVSDVDKMHIVLARSTFPRHNLQNTPPSEHFWKVTCWKKCALLWPEAHVQVKSAKNWQSRTTFGSWDVEKRTPL